MALLLGGESACSSQTGWWEHCGTVTALTFVHMAPGRSVLQVCMAPRFLPMQALMRMLSPRRGDDMREHRLPHWC